MRRSEALQGVRVIKFRDILGRYEASEFNQIEAAELLGISERTFRRWCQRFEQGGETGLLDRRLGNVSGKRVPSDHRLELVRRVNDSAVISVWVGDSGQHVWSRLNPAI